MAGELPRIALRVHEDASRTAQEGVPLPASAPLEVSLCVPCRYVVACGAEDVAYAQNLLSELRQKVASLTVSGVRR